jgi:hypothetical protein
MALSGFFLTLAGLSVSVDATPLRRQDNDAVVRRVKDDG